MQLIRRYRYSYQTIVRYSSTVLNHHFLLRCTPMECGCQSIVEQDVNTLLPTYISSSKDAFGNVIHYGSMINRHDIFVVASTGVVDCGDYRIDESIPHPMYQISTSLTTCSDKMLKFVERVVAGRQNSGGTETVDAGCSGELGVALNQALEMAGEIYNYMSYLTGITNIETKAGESFALRQGVCQDFAHILIAMCRKCNIFARYVAGFVVGTGETHAWVEVYDNGAWYGVDPTHNLLIEKDYIKIAHGRDASDCSVIRGIYRGSVSQSTEVRVVLEQLF